MNRRKFLKHSLALGMAAAASTTFFDSHGLIAQEATPTMPDLVSIRNGSPEAMFDAGIQAIGGMSKFVARGQTVVVKPNIGWNQAPEYAANTHPGLVKRIIEHCYAAGAKRVYVFDHTCSHWESSYKNSGIEYAARQANAVMVPAHTENYYQEVRIPGATVLTTTKVHEILLEPNVFINVPVLKHHMGTRLTIALKNLMGIVWDRVFYHQNNVHQCIADFALFKRPNLNVVDAYNVLMRQGPRGGSLQSVNCMKTQLLSTDIVAIDAAATKLFGMEPRQIPHIMMAHEKNLGNIDVDHLNIRRIVL